MRRVVRFVGSLLFAILAMLVAEALTSEDSSAQGKPPSVVVPGSWETVNLELPAMEEYQQPFMYESWWKEIGACEHLIVPLELTRAVHFIYVNSPTMVVDMDPGVLGFASMETMTIYIVLPHIYTKTILMHEMLHCLLYWNGIDQGKDYHPPSRYGTGKRGVCGVTKYYQ